MLSNKSHVLDQLVAVLPRVFWPLAVQCSHAVTHVLPGSE